MFYPSGQEHLPFLPLDFQKELEIKFVNGEPCRLPVAHTCGLILELTRGASDPEAFAEQMTKTLLWSGRFHLA